LRQSHHCRLFYIFVLVAVALVAHLWRTFHCFSLVPLLFLSFLPCILSRYISVEWKYRVLTQSNRCIIFCTTVLPFIALFTFSATFFLFPAFLRLYKFVELNIYAIYSGAKKHCKTLDAVWFRFRILSRLL
jgi:hypothetical protein